MTKNKEGFSYWSNIKKQIRKNRTAIWSLRILFVLLFIAVFGDFIANDKPIYCQYEGKHFFPVFRQIGLKVGIADSNETYKSLSCDSIYTSSILPLIPYSAIKTDDDNAKFISPFANQKVKSLRFRHWMGTDQTGRDIAAGMVSGTRIAMLVGIISMSIASFIGIILGVLAGYFGDNGFKISRIRLILNFLALPIGLFYGFISRQYQFIEGSFMVEMIKSAGIILFVFSLVNLLAGWLKKISFFSKKIAIPIDLIVMRTIEVFNSIPGLLIILAFVGILDEPSVFYVMIIIGFLAWTNITRFIRAEFLRIKNLEYIEATQSMGFPNWRIIFKHALPNALSPVLITIAFGIAVAILLEAALSFLDIGVNVNEDISWGYLLNIGRTNSSAWWLAVFPGMAIFITVSIFNLLGDALTDAMNPNENRLN